MRLTATQFFNNDMARYRWVGTATSRAGVGSSGTRIHLADPNDAPYICLVRTRYQTIKRMMDIAITLALLPLALPMMAVCGLLIWLQDFGPVVFVQWRTGKHGKRFKMYKFRTMVKDAEKIKSKYTHLNQLTLPDFKIANDPRTTRLGRILRQTSLDEFPQLFNVLRGEMSLVGPRPTSFDLSTYSLPQTERLEVTPGVTGLWQLSGRSDIDFDRRLRLDMQYIESQSLWLDVSIMFKTLMVLTDHNGAY